MEQSPTRGYVELFHLQVPIELRSMETSDQLGTIETLEFQLFIKGPKENPKEIKVELTSEIDLFFHYTHTRNIDTFRDVQHSHKLLIKLSEYPNLLQNLLNNVINTPNQFLSVFYMNAEGAGRFDIVQNMSYKFLELVSCDFQVSNNDIVRKSIISRYSIQKNLLLDVESQISRLEELLKHRAPGIISQIKKKSKLLVSSTN